MHEDKINRGQIVLVFVFSGKGLTLVTSVLEGSWQDKYAAAQAAKQVYLPSF